MTKLRNVAVGVIALLSVGALAACGLDDLTENREENAYEVTDAVTKLDIQAQAGAVTVRAGTGPIKVKEILRYNGSKPKATHVVADGTLRLVDGGCSGIRNCGVEYEVTVPATLGVTVKTSAGAVDASGLSGEVSLETNAGSVEALTMGTKKLRIRSDAGRIRAEFTVVPDDVDVQTSAGSVAVVVPSGSTYAVDAKTSAGSRDITVQTDPASGHKIRAETSAGKIEVRNG
ncbi:DUF4097 family beta strand repeat-containing protein [Longispora fulva]|uniref:DUF4097 and DUF4098 domain-containing protein YvlB n=1 Tax=Longispora fulva TaxID=619741 RepID=A0A8J7KYA4_9ACTN|nr:DUF4097 family beta strand repeat-containing protein [Longispora fulva]MBG6139067.1 DUF4097 and DUF4098 domain-containing protein YvlB [Longispora fulva]